MTSQKYPENYKDCIHVREFYFQFQRNHESTRRTTRPTFVKAFITQ